MQLETYLMFDFFFLCSAYNHCLLICLMAMTFNSHWNFRKSIKVRKIAINFPPAPSQFPRALKLYITIPGLQQFVRCNAGATYKQNNVMCWKLVCWRKHVCNTVSLPSHWSYMGQKRMTGGKYQNLLNTDLIVFWVFRRWLLTNAAPVPVNLHLISMSVKHNYHVKLPQLYYNISQSSFV